MNSQFTRARLYSSSKTGICSVSAPRLTTNKRDLHASYPPVHILHTIGALERNYEFISVGNGLGVMISLPPQGQEECGGKRQKIHGDGDGGGVREC